MDQAIENDIPRVFQLLKPKIEDILAGEKLSGEEVNIACRTLTPEEALGNPERDDFPLQKGREKLMQAEIGEAVGQAFTDRPGNLTGTVSEILSLPPVNNYNRAAIVATLNALLKLRAQVKNTVHCKDDGPRLCGSELAEDIQARYGNPKVVLIGLQPAIAETLSARFKMRIMDLDPANESKTFNGVKVEIGPYSIADFEGWADLFLITGSTIVNGSIDQFLDIKKPVLFFGTTIAGPAELLGLERICPRSE